MEDKINQTLVQLENELQSIVSARKQVEETVKASTDLLKMVSEYVSSVKTLCLGLQSWEADLRAREDSLGEATESALIRINSTCKEIITAFHTDVVNIATDFKTQTESTLSKFVEQNQKLEGFIQKLNTLQNEIQKVTAEIPIIKDELIHLSTSLNEFRSEMDTKEQRLRTILDGTNTKIDLLNEKADNLKSATAQILSAIQSSTTTLTSAIATSKEETAKSININRWIIIIGIIILAALQFVFR